MFDLDGFIEQCKQALQDDVPQNTVRALMEEAFSNPEAVSQALADAAPKNNVAPLYADENLTVLRVFTPPNFVSPIHNHLMWVVIGILEGEEKNYFYRRTENGGVEVEQEVVLTPETGIYPLRADMIHAIEIPSNKPLCGLHVYGGNILERSSRSVWHPDTMEEVPYTFEKVSGYCKTLIDRRKAG
jgi:predicted metal-dependent enzyme (double-stranded beta helix superfamily)